jgi:catechol 2,3-dioxygenase-like lactoylglutathione lyase family enzyme
MGSATRSKDVARSVEFYTRHLGFTLEHQQLPAFARRTRAVFDDLSPRGSMSAHRTTAPYNRAMRYEELPGHDLVEQGLADLARGVESVPALLVAIGAPRLRRLGLPVPDTKVADPEHRLYCELSRSGPDSAHSRYNALLRTLVSFERAAECAS